MAAMGLDLWPLASPDAIVALVAVFEQAILFIRFGRLPDVDLMIPTCSASSEKSIGTLLMLIGFSGTI